MRYRELLDASWAEHLQPRAAGAPTVISTFAGCGGSSLGYSMAGFRELLAVEWDEAAVETFRANFPEIEVFHGDIGSLSVERCLELTGLSVGELDVFDGSPPCQGFSTAGRRDLDDDRNQLFREYARLLAGLRPRAFVMENVSGMVRGKMRLIFVEALRALKACGYKARAGLLNAMYFGVPQARTRLIIVGIREDLGNEPVLPKPLHRPITASQAIGDMPLGEQGNHSEAVLAAWRRSWPGQSPRKRTRNVGSFQSVRLDPHRPAATQIKSHLHWHYAVPRHLTIAEAALLGSFPPEFRWVGSDSAAKERIGNSVPPLLMRAVAQSLRGQLAR